MNFIDEQNCVGLVFERLEHAFEALLKVTAVLGACEQCAHVQRIHHGLCQNLRHVVLRNAPSQSFSNGGFSDTRLAYQQGVVLAAAAQNLNRALHFEVATNKRINLALFGGLVQVLGELLKR